MKGHEVEIDMEETTPLQHDGDTREKMLTPPPPPLPPPPEGGDKDHHQDGGLTNGNTSPSEQKEEEADPNIQHHGYECDGCQMNPIVGTRYQCTECPIYNLCSDCQSKGLHNGHPLKSILLPIWRPEDFKKRECNTFIEDSSRDGRCQCGRPRDRHPTDIKTAEDTEWWTTELHSSEQQTDAYGTLRFEGERHPRLFLRLSSHTEPSRVYDLMSRKIRDDGGWRMDPPPLVVSVVGGEGRSEVKPWVQEVIREGLVKALSKTATATATGRSLPRILTEGFDEGVGRCVGEAKRGCSVLAVAIAPWAVVYNREHLVDPKGYYGQYSVENRTSDSCCLEKNHYAFLLVDDGREGHRGGEKNFWVKFEEHIPTRHIKDSSSITIPVLCMLISGELSMLERVDLSLKSATPWLVLAGSGGVADLLSDILENQSPASAGDDVARVKELVQKHFPSEALIDQLVEQVQSIISNRKLITFYHEEKDRPEDFDTVMIKALMPASKQRASGNAFRYDGELILAMRWNRVDFFCRQLSNDYISDDDININWKDEALKDCMTFALTNDKTQYTVRLFIEKKFNFEEHLTYGLLEKLYSTVNKDTLLYKLLLEQLKERLGTTWKPADPSDPLNLKEISLFEEISLLEVSGVLKKFMGEEKPFYFTALGLKDFTSGKKALERAKELLKGECPYRNQRCKSAWTHLFIWAVLQNYSDLADIFWEKAEEPVLNALGACKMLQEMSKSKLEIQTETKLSMEKLTQKFEDRAHGILGSCYQTDESLSFKLLNRMSPVWDMNCFQMGIAVESHSFFKHDGLESTLSQAWRGDMKKDTSVWKVLLCLFCFPLCFTNFISYRGKYDDCRWSGKIREAVKEKSKPSKVSRWPMFWRAPVTSFVGNAMMYILFLFLFAYVLLVDFKPPPPCGPSSWEYVLCFWVFTFLCEEIYEAFFGRYRYMTLYQKMRLHLKDFWNMCDLIAIILFIIGLICRMFEWSYEFGRGVLCIDYMVFTIRLIHISTIHKEMGPKIIIVGKMMKDFGFFLFFLAVWIVAYGVATQGLLYHYDPDLDRIFRRVIYRPFLYIFGDLKLEEIDAGQEWNISCTYNMTLIDGGAEPCRSEFNNWMVIVLLVVFLLVTNILLINLLIAIFGNTFNKVDDNSNLYWRFQHYNLLMEFESRPCLAPPFNILHHLTVLVCCLPLLGPGWREELYEGSDVWSREGEVKDMEMEQKQKFLSDQKETESNSDSERIKQISDKVDNVLKQVTETFDQKIHQMTDRVDRMEKQLNDQFTAQRTEMRALETKMDQILDLLTKPKSP